jgi:hypothetical protein
MTKQEIDRTFFLMQVEIDVLSEKMFASQRLAQVRDIFLFSCYRGLSYVDLNMTKGQRLKRTGFDSQSRICLLLTYTMNLSPIY